MDESTLSPSVIRTALDQARQTAVQIGVLREANARTIRTLETAFNQALNGPSQPSEAVLRKSEIRSRIEADEELRAFILARITALTFDRVLTEVAAHFPSDRRPSRSALHRWWHRHGRRSSVPQPAVTSKSR